MPYCNALPCNTLPRAVRAAVACHRTATPHTSYRPYLSEPRSGLPARAPMAARRA